MSESQNPEKRIIIDEDWKTQVEAEKAAARDESPQAAIVPDASGGPTLPPPDLLFLASTLYYQAMIGLGMIPNPIDGKASPRLTAAQHSIDLLTMLWEKTAGNRTPEESDALDAMLHELRMAFIGAQTGGQSEK